MSTLYVTFVNSNDASLEGILSSSFLSDDEVNSLSKYKTLEMKKEKACSMVLKNKYVGEYHINEFGKPISEKTYFNISHSKGVVVFIKDDVPIGIDIELIRPIKEDLEDFISSKEEREYIKNDTNFFEIWTNKESLMKNIGTGINDVLKEIPALPINGTKKYKGKEYYSKVTIYNGYVISITREGNEPFDIKIKEEQI